MELPALHQPMCHLSWAADTIPSSCPSTRYQRSTTPWEVARGPRTGLLGRHISFHALLRASLTGGAGRCVISGIRQVSGILSSLASLGGQQMALPGPA